MLFFRLCSIFMLFYFGDCRESKASEEDDYVDPFDIMNFDPSHVVMRNKPLVLENQPDPDGNGGSQQISLADKETKPTSQPGKQSQTTEQTAPPDNQKENADSAETSSEKEEMTEKSSQTLPEANSCIILNSLFRQYLKQLVNVLEPKISSPSSQEAISLRLSLSHQDLARLRYYSDGAKDDVHLVHETLSDMIQGAYMTEKVGIAHYWLEEYLGLSPEFLLHMSTILACTVVIVKSLYVMKVKFFLLLATVVSVLFTWMEMYQKVKAEREKLFQQVDHAKCADLSKLPWYSRLAQFVSSSLTFQDEECRDYYQATMVNPVFKVSPLEACAVAFVKTVVTPLEIIGHGLQRFFVGLLKDLPAQWMLIILICVGVLIFFSIFISTGYRFRVPWLLTIEPGHQPSIDYGHQHLPSLAADGDSGRHRESLTQEVLDQLRKLSISDAGDERKDIDTTAPTLALPQQSGEKALRETRITAENNVDVKPKQIDSQISDSLQEQQVTTTVASASRSEECKCNKKPGIGFENIVPDFNFERVPHLENDDADPALRHEPVCSTFKERDFVDGGEQEKAMSRESCKGTNEGYNGDLDEKLVQDDKGSAERGGKNFPDDG